MADFYVDQAAGLRRLFGQEPVRVVNFIAGRTGVGRTVALAQLAATLARQGQEVLVLDENIRKPVADLFGVPHRADLFQVMNGHVAMAEALLPVCAGVTVLPVARAIRAMAGFNPAQQRALVGALEQIDRPVDVILVDSAQDNPAGVSPLGLAAGETMVVVSGDTAAITEAYALIKRMSMTYGRRHFRALLNNIRLPEEAAAIFDNMAQVAASRLGVRVDLAATLPHDDALRRAVQVAQPVIGAYPDSPVAYALRMLAADLMTWPVADSQGPGGLGQFTQQLLHLSQRITPAAVHAG